MLWDNSLHMWRISILCVRQVPQSYTDLQQAVIQEAERRRSTGEPPILLEDEILQLAKSSPENDILDTEELTLGKCVWLSLRQDDVTTTSFPWILKRGWPANVRRFLRCFQGKSFSFVSMWYFQSNLNYKPMISKRFMIFFVKLFLHTNGSTISVTLKISRF